MVAVDFSILNQKATPAIYADTLALRPAAGFAGRLFVDTASPYGVYRDTGSIWVQIASGTGGGTSTGVNGLNGTTNIGLGGTLANNTTINGGNNQLTITAVSTFNNSALNYNATGGAVGDYASVFLSATQLRLQKTNLVGVYSEINFIDTNIKSIFSGSNYGISLDDTNGKFVIGDYSNGRKYNAFVVNDDTNEFYINTSYNQINNNEKDLFYASNGSAGIRFVKLGDFDNYSNGVCLIIDDANLEINTKQGGNFKGIALNFNSELYRLGDSSTNINTDTSNNQIELVANGLKLTGVATSSSGSAIIPAEFINIVVNGNNRKIQLFA